MHCTDSQNSSLAHRFESFPFSYNKFLLYVLKYVTTYAVSGLYLHIYIHIFIYMLMCDSFKVNKGLVISVPCFYASINGLIHLIKLFFHTKMCSLLLLSKLSPQFLCYFSYIFSPFPTPNLIIEFELIILNPIHGFRLLLSLSPLM